MAAVPVVKKPASNANRPRTCAKLALWALKLASAASMISWQCLVTSMKMNARIPTENIASATRSWSLTRSTRPSGRPR